MFNGSFPVETFLSHPVVLELICYRTRANQLINERNTTEGLKKIWTGLEFFCTLAPSSWDPQDNFSKGWHQRCWTKSKAVTRLVADLQRSDKDESTSRPNFSQLSCCIGVDLLSYESIPTDKWEQYDWRAEENLDGVIFIAHTSFDICTDIMRKKQSPWKGEVTWYAFFKSIIFSSRSVCV